MAWLRSRIERSSGLTTYAIEWREGGKVRARQLGPVTEKEAQYELAAMQAGKRTRRAAIAVDAKRAVREYLKHLKVSGRRQGTIDHDQDKLKPLLDEWGDRAMAGWSRAMLETLLHDRSWSSSRVRQALGVYRRFIAWCRAVGYVCGDFVGEFKPHGFDSPQPTLQPHDTHAELGAAGVGRSTGHDRSRFPPHPPRGGRARNPVPRGEADVPGLADEVNEAVVVGALPAARGHRAIVGSGHPRRSYAWSDRVGSA